MAVGAKIISRRAQLTSPSDADGGCSACGAGDRTSIVALLTNLLRTLLKYISRVIDRHSYRSSYLTVSRLPRKNQSTCVSTRDYYRMLS